MKKRAIYAGTFDPFTNGHLDIVQRALKLFDEVTLVIAVPPQKKPLLSGEKRAKILKEIFKDESRVIVDTCDALIVDYAKSKGIDFLVRGLRPTGDFDNEFQMASMNRRLNHNLDTVFLATDDNNYYISSSLIREIYSHGGDISPFVPQKVLEYLKKK